jgi:predicted RNA-binding protein with PIN domain
MMARVFLHVIIDGRSVAGARADIGERQLVEAVASWAASHPRTPVVAIVFAGLYEGGEPGMSEHDERTVVVATGDEGAADVIVGEVEELRADSEPVIVVTSDAELHARVELHGAKVIASAAFARTILA